MEKIKLIKDSEFKRVTNKFHELYEKLNGSK